MTTYTLTISTDELGLGVIDGGKVVVTRKRATVADQYPPISALYAITTATADTGIATVALKADDSSTYHECMAWDEGGAVVYRQSFSMPPEACDLHNLSDAVFGSSDIQFKDDGANRGTPSTTRNVNFTGQDVSSTFSGETLTVAVDSTPTVGAAITAHSAELDPHGDREYADSQFIKLSTARSLSSEMPDGLPTAMSTTGQAMTSFGNAPLTVASGEISHAWNGVSASSAGYMQTRPKPGSTCTRIGAVVRADVGSVSTLDLILPGSAWSQNNYTAAGIHYVVKTDGNWHVSYWDGSTEDYYGSGVIDAWDDGTERRVEVSVDLSTSSVTVQNPDGSIHTFTDSRIASNLSEYAVWELFNSSGALEVDPPKILRWWADTATPEDRAAVAPRDLALALDSVRATIPPTDAYLIYSPSTQMTSTTTGSPATISTSTVYVQVTPGSTGKVLLDFSAYYEFSANDTLFLRYSITGVGDGPIFAAAVGSTGSAMLVRQLIEITDLAPDVVATIKIKHYTGSSGSATCKAGGSGAGLLPPLTLRATKVLA